MKRKLLILVVVAIFGLYVLSMSASSPTNIGISNGKLAPLPESPNAVSTQSDDRQRTMEPLKMSGSAKAAIEQLAMLIADMPRTHIVNRSDNYLHVEFTSLIFRFVDDVEFHADESSGQIHFRSASRVGHSDMGANRKRMEVITRNWDGIQ